MVIYLRDLYYPDGFAFLTFAVGKEYGCGIAARAACYYAGGIMFSRGVL